MIQVGQTKLFTFSVIPPDSSSYRYVWFWWDGTVSATVVPFVEKRINLGGIPATRNLSYTVRVIDAAGQSAEYTHSFQANNPPGIVPSPSVSVNDAAFSYATVLSTTAYDLESDPFVFAYYENGTFLGNGATVSAGLVDGTYYGTRYPDLNGFTSTFGITVANERTITCKVIDSQYGTSSGTTSFDVNLRGYTAAWPQASISVQAQLATSDATSLPVQRIGVGQNMDFSVYAKDVLGRDLNFTWMFNGSYGWAATSYAAGATVAQPDGGFISTITKSLELPETAGEKRAVVYVANASTQEVTTLSADVLLLANSNPGTPSFTVINAATLAPITPPGPVAAGSTLLISASVVDADSDIVDYKWAFVQPSAAYFTNLVLAGPKVLLTTTGYQAGNNVLGTLVCTDRLGGSVTASVPVITLN